MADIPGFRAGQGDFEALLDGLPWHRAQERDAEALIAGYGLQAMEVVWEHLTDDRLIEWEHMYWAGVSGIVASRLRDLPADERARLVEQELRAWRGEPRRRVL